jgi:hypothetical protein
MKRLMRILLVVGVLAGGLALGSPSSEAGPWGRGPFRRVGWGRYYGPGWGGWGYRAYRPLGYGWGGYGLGYRPYGWGYGGYGWGYPGYGYGINNPALGIFGFGSGYSGYGFGYPGFYGTNISVGSPMGGFYMSSYPY